MAPDPKEPRARRRGTIQLQTVANETSALRWLRHRNNPRTQSEGIPTAISAGVDANNSHFGIERMRGARMRKRVHATCPGATLHLIEPTTVLSHPDLVILRIGPFGGVDPGGEGEGQVLPVHFAGDAGLHDAVHEE